MKLLMVLKAAFGAIARNKARAFLTCFGIIVGIAAVILVLALGKSAQVVMVRQFEDLGTNIIVISPNQNRIGAVRSGAGTGETLTAEDAEAILLHLPDHVSGVSPVVSSTCQLIRENRNWSAVALGVSHTYLPIIRHPVGVGRFFDETDQKRAKRVCVIGTTVRDRLFGGNRNPIGELIRIKDMPFRVIGLLEHKGLNAVGQDQDDTVLLPYTTAAAVLQGSAFRSVNRILVQARHMDALLPAKDAICGLLRSRHRIREGQDDDFEVKDSIAVVNTISSVLLIVTILLTVVASISLGVGGIGIMNIMLVSVTERIKEIGLRMAIGARPLDILGQFIFEAIALSSLGGAAGLLLGGGIAYAVGFFVGCSDPVDAVGALVAIAVSVAVGVFFGFYPAYRASRLNSIQCLRNE